jgi:hypothetical protein
MDSAVAVGVYLAISVILFLVFRAVMLWYWRINEVVTLLKSIDDKLGRGAPKDARLPIGGVVQEPSQNRKEEDERFEQWLKSQTPPVVNPTASQRAEYRAAFDYKRGHGEL